MQVLIDFIITPLNLHPKLHNNLGATDDANRVPMGYWWGPLQTLEIFILGIIRESHHLAGSMQEVLEFSRSQVAIICGRCSISHTSRESSHGGITRSWTMVQNNSFSN